MSQAIIKIGTMSFLFDEGEVAKDLLLHSDDYLQRMSCSERAVRMLSDRTDISEEEFRNHVAQQVMPWEQSEIDGLVDDLTHIESLLAKYSIKWPDVIHMVKTTGEEDIREAAAYCRGNTIVLTQQTIEYGAYQTLIHELSHIQSQNDPIRRQQLYKVVGFEECNEIDLPQELATLRLTNPDAPKLNVRIRVTVEGSQFDVVPVLLYDAKRGFSFLQRLYIKMLAIEKTNNDQWSYVKKNGQAVIFDPSECPDFDEQVGNNTDYNFHPEEILADNFRFMVEGTTVPTPRIIDEMKTIYQVAITQS